MKYFAIVILAIFASSCCGTKKAIETQPIPTEEIAMASEVPDDVPTEAEIENEVEVVTINEIEVEDTTAEETSIDIQSLEINDDFDHSLWNNLLQKYVSEAGIVNYKAFKNKSSELRKYIATLSETIPHEEWSSSQKLAYWINAYNALTIDLIIRNYPLESIKDIKDPWDQRLWKFGNQWLNLNDIEHQILRKMNEPRIHFGIVCASFSCPKLQNEAFTASNLDVLLTKATREFLADTKRNEISAERIALSKIFKWFKKDFEQNGTLTDFLNQYSDVTISKNAKKSFKDYNWDLND